MGVILKPSIRTHFAGSKTDNLKKSYFNILQTKKRESHNWLSRCYSASSATTAMTMTAISAMMTRRGRSVSGNHNRTGRRRHYNNRARRRSYDNWCRCNYDRTGRRRHYNRCRCNYNRCRCNYNRAGVYQIQGCPYKINN